MPKGLCFADVTFFYPFRFNGRLGDQLSQNILDRSSPIFQDTYMHGMINLTLISQSLYGNLFLRKSAKIGIPHLHSVRWHSTTDGRTQTWTHPLQMTSLRMIKIG